MSDLSGIQKIIYSDDTTNTSMDQRAERKDPSLAIDTVDRAVRVMLDNERNEDGYKYEESYICLLYTSMQKKGGWQGREASMHSFSSIWWKKYPA